MVQRVDTVFDPQAQSKKSLQRDHNVSGSHVLRRIIIAIDQQDAAVLPPVRLPKFMEVYEVPRIMRE